MNCPKCGYTRKLKETVPEGQCPSCGIYYAKVNTTASPASGPGKMVPAQAGNSWKFAMVLVAAAAVAGLVAVSPASQWLRGTPAGRDASSAQAMPTRLRDVDFSRARIVMYSLTDCEYCAELRHKFEDNRVPFTEYFIDTEPQRQNELTQKLQAAGFSGGAFGTPTLEVNGKMMPNNPPVEEIIKQVMS